MPSADHNQGSELHLSFRRNATAIFILVTVQVLVAIFGANQLAKGARFHQFNHLHVSYDMIFRQHLDEAHLPLTQADLAQFAEDIRLIRQQPIDCLKTVAWYDRIFLWAIGTQRALELCELDIEVANQALASLDRVQSHDLGYEKALNMFIRTSKQFHANSEEFEPLVHASVEAIHIAVLLMVVISGLLSIFMVASLVRSMTRSFKIVEQLRLIADSASQSKSQYLANMSHEIRTPLNGVLGNIEIAKDLIQNEEAKHHISIAARSADSLLSIINDILDLAKIEAGKLHIETIEFDLAAVINDVSQLYMGPAKTKGVDIKLICALKKPIRRGDPTRIRQILANLVSNALKFTPEGGTITIRGYEGGNIIGFSVKDTGVGIARDKQQQIFQAFEQAESVTTRKFGGTGLGLSIVLRLINTMKGRLTLDSREGEGSCFQIWLPLEAAETQAIPRPRDSSRSGYEVLGPMRILVVDDTPTNLLVARKLLERMGHTVDVAESGAEAIEKYSAGEYALVFMDIQMPELDGVETTQRLRHIHGHQLAPVVALTAHAMSTDREKYLAAGMDGYMSKPVGAKAFRLCFQEIFGRL